MKGIVKKITSLTLVAAVAIASVCGGVRIQGVTPEVKGARAAQSQGKYVKSLAISYASSREKAQEELGEEYTILDQNFNEGMSGDSWIGYTTTDDPDDAIRDIKVENMTGKHSTSEYEELLSRQKDMVDEQIDTIVPVLSEFAKNVEDKLPAAIEVKDALNYYYEDDSELKFGDFFMEAGKKLREDPKDSDTRKKLEKVFVEGNNTVIQTAEKLLTMGLGKKVNESGSWLTRMSKLGPNGLIDIYKQANPSLRRKEAVLKIIEQDYGTDADALLKGIITVQDVIREAEQSELGKAIESGDEKTRDSILDEAVNQKIGEEPTDESTIEDITDSLITTMETTPDTIETSNNWSTEVLIITLKNTPYGDGQTMYDFFMRQDLKKADLYPMAYVLSEAQKSIITDIGLMSLFESVMAENVGKDEEAAPVEEYIEAGCCSVYEGVDRDVFKGDTAITEDTLKRMSTKDEFNITDQDPLIAGLSAMLAVTLGSFMVVKFSGEFTRVVEKEITAYQRVGLTEANKSFAVEKFKQEIDLMSKNPDALKLKYIEQKKWLKSFKPEILNKSATAINTDLYNAMIRLADNYEMEKVMEIEKLSPETQEKFLRYQRGNKLYKLLDKEAARVKPVKAIKTVKAPARWGARIAYMLGAVAAFAFAGYEIYCIVKPKPGVEFTEIPAKMISRSYTDDSDEIDNMTYTAVRTKDGEKADLHNRKGKEWQAIYVTGDVNAGDPVLASSLKTTDGGISDAEAIPVTEFCYSDACNLRDKTVTDENTGSVYLYFRTGVDAIEEVAEEPDEVAADSVASGDAADAEAGPTAAVFGPSSLIWILSLLLIALIAAGAGVYARKRKKRE